MSTPGILLELLMAGFFAVACVRARARLLGSSTPSLKDFFQLTDRVERLRRSRWQWCSMVLLLLVVRRQTGLPLVAELIVPIQLLVFLALPTAKPAEGRAL